MRKLAGRSVFFAALAVPIVMFAGPLAASADPVDTASERGCCPDVVTNVEDVNANQNGNVNGVYIDNDTNDTNLDIHQHDHWYDGYFTPVQPTDPVTFDDQATYVPQVVMDSAPQNVTDIVPQNVSDSLPQNVSGIVPQNVTDMVPQAVSGIVPQNVTDIVPQNVTDMVPQAVTESVPQNAAESAPQNAMDSAPQNVSDMLPQNVTDSAPQNVTESVPVNAAPQDQVSPVQELQSVDISNLARDDHPNSP